LTHINTPAGSEVPEEVQN